MIMNARTILGLVVLFGVRLGARPYQADHMLGGVAVCRA